MTSAANAIFTIAHIACSILGFGAVAVTGVEALVTKSSPQSLAAARYFKPGPNWISLLVLLTPVFGAAIEVVNNYPDVHMLWPWLAFAFWIVAAVAGIFVHWPAERTIQRLLAGSGAGDTIGTDNLDSTTSPRALDRACVAAAISSAVMFATFVAALVVMVTQPA